MGEGFLSIPGRPLNHFVLFYDFMVKNKKTLLCQFLPHDFLKFLLLCIVFRETNQNISHPVSHLMLILVLFIVSAYLVAN